MWLVVEKNERMSRMFTIVEISEQWSRIPEVCRRSKYIVYYTSRYMATYLALLALFNRHIFSICIMARQDPYHIRNTTIVLPLLTRLDELSSGVSPQVSNDTEAEVRRVFTIGRTPICSNQLSGQAVNAAAPNVSTPTTTQSSSNVRANEAQLPPSNRSFVMRRNFSAPRPSNSARNSARRQKRSSVIDNRSVMRDLTLLAGPDSVFVPRQGARLALMEYAHMISACRFTRGMTAAQVEVAIFEAYDGKIPAGDWITFLNFLIICKLSCLHTIATLWNVKNLNATAKLHFPMDSWHNAH